MHGDFHAAVAVIEDVTLAAEGTATFTEMKNMLVQRVDHELRTPLSTSLGHAELLEEEPDLPASARNSVEAVHRAGPPPP